MFGEIKQLRHYKPSFPHQYPLPEQGVRNPGAVLAAGLPDVCRRIPSRSPTRGEMDMRQILTELEPEVAAITDSYLAAKTADYLLVTEHPAAEHGGPERTATVAGAAVDGAEQSGTVGADRFSSK